MERGLQKVDQHSQLALKCRNNSKHPLWGLRVDIQAGASVEMIEAIIQALKSC